ncbi:hypothetical protein GCM10023172_41330 [Hymenobacter ginsengisoli]|uniref:DUF4350 domain-containing protein n=1 Tax=Hymenobacter ginsengisoli TaxID=1051626 RepID=A0ABP8QU14_9BACT|nr:MULTISPECIES: DUF4350 domain-containing protein [unclassified Hymenobacter]MBO2032223.1 DUF4350 domain-containing protein [Hymenobacter sp. BT559]
MTTFRWYLLGLLALFGGYVALEYYRPKPLDWSPSLSSKDKIPYGTYALFDVLPQVLGSDSVASVRQPLYNQLLGAEEPHLKSGRSSNVDFADDSVDAANDRAAAELEAASLPLVSTRAHYLFVNQEFTATPLETNALLRFVAQGHDVFIAAENFAGRRGHALTDTLGFRTYPADSSFAQVLAPGAGRADSVALHLLRPVAGGPQQFWFNAAAVSYRLALMARPAHHGATLAADAKGRPVLLRLHHGRGHFYLCSVPLAFGNYWLLRPRTADFAFASLSYLPAGRPVWWDEYQKQGRAGSQSVLRVVMAHPALRTAYYLLLATGLLFVLVEARRRQRIIPVIKPLPNTTLLFTRTVAGLYKQGRNHSSMAEKKTALFLDYLRTRFHEPTPDLADEEFRERLSQKSGVPRARVDELVRYINFARTAPIVTDRELLVVSRAMQDFKRESQ